MNPSPFDLLPHEVTLLILEEYCKNNPERKLISSFVCQIWRQLSTNIHTDSIDLLSRNFIESGYLKSLEMVWKFRTGKYVHSLLLCSPGR